METLLKEAVSVADAHVNNQTSTPANQKRVATLGMAMTEKQGGFDVRANTTRATPLGNGPFALSGHKWFCSAPMCDAFLTLAYSDKGLTCFLVPRWTPDGDRNAMHIMRLKDKLGDRANASSEIEYHGAYARQVGEEGRGVQTIIEMVSTTPASTARSHPPRTCAKRSRRRYGTRRIAPRSR